jgi:hypothetical protein
LKERCNGRGDEEEEVDSSWMALRKREDTRIRRRKHEIALPGELSWKRL